MGADCHLDAFIKRSSTVGEASSPRLIGGLESQRLLR
jgi:hypothetical protein